MKPRGKENDPRVWSLDRATSHLSESVLVLDCVFFFFLPSALDLTSLTVNVFSLMTLSPHFFNTLQLPRHHVYSTSRTHVLYYTYESAHKLVAPY